MSEIKLNTIEEALEDFRNGEFVIVVDDEDRENEGDFIIAAEKVTPEKINFMMRYGRGVLCAPITEDRLIQRVSLAMAPATCSLPSVSNALALPTRSMKTMVWLRFMAATRARRRGRRRFLFGVFDVESRGARGPSAQNA